MSQLPEGWNKIKLDCLLDFVIGGDWGKEPDFNHTDFENVLCIRGTEFRHWSKEKGKTAVSRKVKSSSLAKRKLELGDIIIEISGGGPEQPVGRTVIIDEKAISIANGVPLVCTNFTRLARPSKEVDSAFLNYFLTFFYNSGEITKYQSGSNNLRNLQFQDYVKIGVPLASVAEQTRIVEKLDEVLAQVEAIQARLARIPDIIKRFRQSVLAAAVSGKLTGGWREQVEELKAIAIAEENLYVPSSWNTSTLESLILPSRKICYGVVQPGELVDGGQPLIRVCDINNGVVDYSGLRTISRDIDSQYKRSKVQKHDLLVTIVGAIGRVAIVTEDIEANIARAVARLSPNVDIVDPKYLLIWLSCPKLQWWLNNSSREVARKTLNLSELKQANVAFPSIEEQKEIVRLVDQYFAFADTIEAQVKKAQTRVDKLTQAILAKAFRGELTADWRAANPDLISGDHSAAALLARIQAERVTASGKKGKRGTSKSRTTA